MNNYVLYWIEDKDDVYLGRNLEEILALHVERTGDDIEEIDYGEVTEPEKYVDRHSGKTLKDFAEEYSLHSSRIPEQIWFQYGDI